MMARAGRSGVQFVGAESHAMRKEATFFDVAIRRKEVLIARSVLDEVRRRAIPLRGGQTIAEREKEREKEKEKEEEKLEKARAAAWAWYQHGKGGKESISSSSSSGSGAAFTVSPRSGELGHKSSRFKTEALRTSGNSISSEAESDHGRGECGHLRSKSGRSWDLSNVSVSPTSSLFDSYELDCVSKRIDTAFHGKGCSFTTPPTGLTALRSGFDSVHESEWPSVIKPTMGLPPSTRPPRARAPYGPQVISIPHRSQVSISSPKVTRNSNYRMQFPQVISMPHGSQVLISSRKVTRNSSLRMQFPRCICSSISDVVTHEEMSLGADIPKCDCQKTRANQSDGSGWSLRRITRAIQEFIHFPESEYHPQQEHHERRHARLHLHQHFTSTTIGRTINTAITRTIKSN